MKILIITEFFAPSWAFGGPPKVLFDIARELVKRRHSVTVFTTNVLDAHSQIEKKYDVIEGVKVHYLKTLSTWLAWNWKIFLPLGLRKLLKENIHNYDLIVLASFRTIFSILSYQCAIKSAKPYILVPHGALPRGAGLKKVIKWGLDPFFGYNLLRNASLVLVQTENEMQQAKKYGGKATSIKLVPLNIDLSEFENLPPKGSFRAKVNVTDDERLILFLGRVHENKGLDLLIRSFRHMLQIRSNYKLVIVGRDDGYLSSMLRLINLLGLEGKVIFAGPLYGKNRIQAYVDADVFVMPSSHFEETSTAALEACAACTPVVVTKQASIPNLDLYQAGFTINYDQKELESALLKILDNENLKLRMGENARNLVKENHSSTAWAVQLEEFFSMKE